MRSENLLVRISMPKRIYLLISEKRLKRKMARKIAYEVAEQMKIEYFYDDTNDRIIVDGTLKIITDKGVDNE